MKIGLWAPRGGRMDMNGRGSKDEPTGLESFAYSTDVIRRAEDGGFDITLVAQRYIGQDIDAWVLASALAAQTKSIDLMVAIHPGIVTPGVVAKMGASLDQISNGRFAINLVNAWNRPELEKAGIGFPEHDARYDYGREWISVVEPLLRGEALTHKGERFDVDEYMLRPADPFRPRPSIYVGGESAPARQLVADKGDVWFINGQPLDDVRALIADVAARPRSGPPLRYGLSAFVIARETEAEAQAHLEHLFALAAKDAPIRAVQHANTDAASVMAATMRKSARVGSNGGTAAGLVGTYDQVAARIRAFHDAGIELYMLQFQPFEADMRRFAAEVMPRVKALG